MDDIDKLEEFIEGKTMILQGYGNDESSICFREWSVDDLKELRYLASLALVEALCNEHGECMKRIFKENKYDKPE